MHMKRMIAVSPSKQRYLTCLWTPPFRKGRQVRTTADTRLKFLGCNFLQIANPSPLTSPPIEFPKTDTILYPSIFPIARTSTFIDLLHLHAWFHTCYPTARRWSASCTVMPPCLPCYVCFRYVHLVDFRCLTMLRCIFAVLSFAIDLKLLFFSLFSRAMPVLQT